MNFRFIDAHSHLNDPSFDADISETLMRMREAGVATIVVGTDRAMSEKAITLANAHHDIWATVGIHPADDPSATYDEIAYHEMAKDSRVVAIGECGIDYYRLDKFPGNKDAEANRQQELFEQQMILAASVDKPLMIHGRPTSGTMDAYENLLHILKNGQRRHGDKVRGNVHFFVGNIDIAKQFLDMGFTMSFTGVLTFTHDYDAVIKYIPLESLHVETDAPYVAPVPHRGKRNEPSFVPLILKSLAQIRNEDETRVRDTLLQNALRIFHLTAT